MKSKRKRAGTFSEEGLIVSNKQHSFCYKQSTKPSFQQQSFKLVSSFKYKKVLSHIMEHDKLKMECSVNSNQENKNFNFNPYVTSDKTKYDSHASESPCRSSVKSKKAEHYGSLKCVGEMRPRIFSVVKEKPVMSPLVNGSGQLKALPYETPTKRQLLEINTFSEVIKQFHQDDCLEDMKIHQGEGNQNRISTNSLKYHIKSANQNFVSKLQEQYEEGDPKYTEAAPKLAELYIEGKRCGRDYTKALEILVLSSLVQSKYLLTKLAFLEQRYDDVYHYCEFYIPKKCTCEASSPKGKKIDIGGAPNHAIECLEQEKTDCFMHLCEEIKSQIVLSIGETEAARFQKVGSTISHNPKGSKSIA